MTTPTCTFIQGDVQTMQRSTSAPAALTAGDILTNGLLTLIAHANFAVGDVEELAYQGGIYGVAKHADTDFNLGDIVHVDFSTGLAVRAPTATSRPFGVCTKTTADAATKVEASHCQFLPGQDQILATVTATADGLTTGLIPPGATFVTVTSGNANHQISLPAGNVGDEIILLVGATGCELIAAVAEDKVNDVLVGTTNEAALTATNFYRCNYVAANTWVVVGVTKLGAVQAALVPDAR